MERNRGAEGDRGRTDEGLDGWSDVQRRLREGVQILCGMGRGKKRDKDERVKQMLRSREKGEIGEGR